MKNKRKHDFNVPLNIEDEYGSDFLLNVFAKMARVRFFEKGVIDAVNKKKITSPVYLSTGQESVAAVLSLKMKTYLTFPQHRAHDIYISFGGDLDKLRDELLGLESGTSRGRAGSNCIQLHDGGVSIFGHHGLIGENVPQAVGAALGSKIKTLCIFGDGAAEEDYVLAALGFASSNKLPITFICIDNNLSILTPVEVRRSWNVLDVAKGFGIESYECADDPRAIAHYLSKSDHTAPMLINVHVCRAYWHAGIGVDGEPEWDRFGLIKEELDSLGHRNIINKLEEDIQSEMEDIWGSIQ